MSDPSQPEFWNSCYESDQTPWDFGGVPADLKEYLQSNPKGGRVLIPGCGSGYEVKAFAEAGYEVTALDLAPVAIERARKLAGPALARHVVVGDFFHYDFAATTFDVIYERTFLSAIMPDRRAAYRDRMTRLLKYSGRLIGYFYYQNTDTKDGPPFGLAWGEADELFSRHFVLMKDTAVADSLPAFAGRERWQERHRNSTPRVASSG